MNEHEERYFSERKILTNEIADAVENYIRGGERGGASRDTPLAVLACSLTHCLYSSVNSLPIPFSESTDNSSFFLQSI